MKRKGTFLLAAVFASALIFLVGLSLALADTATHTPIIGPSQATQEQMLMYFKINNSSSNVPFDINQFVSTVISEAKAENVRADVAFAQMMKETNFLKFGGAVQASQNNFAGLGATDSTTPGESFPTMQIGIRAVIQHLQAYATTTPLNQAVVDPRYSLVQRGSAPYVEWLGTNENPLHVGWATDPGYGLDIVNRVNIIKSLLPLQMFVDTPSNGSTVKNTVTISGWAISATSTQSVTVSKADGTQLATGPLSLYQRSDVHAAYPSYPANQPNGFSLSLDATQLPNGPQTVLVRANSAPDATGFSQNATWNLNLNVNNLPPRLYIDGPTAGSTLRGTVAVGGWALNISGLQSVTMLTADGKSTVISQFTHRADVSAAYPGYPDPNSFGLTLDTTTLPNGSQSIKFVALGKNGDTTSISIPVTVDNAPKLTVDTLGSGSTVKGRITVGGWALNINGMQSVQLQKTDGTPLGAAITTFTPRPDVAKAYPGYPGGDMSGFIASLDTTQLPNGLQTIQVVGTGKPDASGKSQSITLNLRVNVSNLPARLYIDGPKTGSTLRGMVAVGGWALNVSGLQSVTMLTADGKSTVISQFTHRADVSAAYPGYPDPNSFGLTLDTTTLPNGSQSITFVALGENGDTASISIPVTVDNTAKLTVDTPGSGSTVKGLITVGGWALNINGMQSVQLQKTDGTPLGAAITTFTPRSDVAKAYPGYPGGDMSGFIASLDTTQLPGGLQTIQVVGTGKPDASGKSQSITLNLRLNVSNLPARMNIDAPQAGSTLSGAVAVSGWALNVTGLQSVTMITANGKSTVINQFTHRADVSTAYPGYPDPNSFGLTLDTTTLPNGNQSIKFVALGKNGDTVSINVPVTVNNAPTLMYIDGPQNGASLKGSVAVSGWALNVSGLQSVKLLRADGSAIPQTVTTFTHRTDVAASYPGYPDVNAFAFTLDTTQLPNGPQTIKIVVTGNNTESVSRSIAVTVNNLPTQMNIDSPVNGTLVQKGESVTISGWALNISGLKRVDVLKPDGTVITSVNSGFTARPDVDAAYPGYTNAEPAGFSFTLDTTPLSPGAQTLTLRAVGNNTDTSSWNLTLNIAKNLVVLDPGHGGRDPGAVANGLQEKNVTLAIALKVRNLLIARGIQVVMTRTSDVDLDPDAIYGAAQDLAARDVIVNSSDASAFVSIHANSYTDPIATGVLGTYFDHNTGYAATYNNGVYDYDPLAQVNAPLSLDLANRVAGAVAADTAQGQRPNESHAYAVLRNSEVPSTLVEVGFLTNPATAAAMQTDAWLNEAAQGIADGISTYLAAH